MTVDYTDRVTEVLPVGKAWTRQIGTVLVRLAGAFGLELGRVHDRVDALDLEKDPRTVDEMLPDWEEVLGLPDPEVIPEPTTEDERRALATARFIARGAEWGGSSRLLLISILNALGFETADIMFRVPAGRPFVCGESECGAQPVNAPQSMFFAEIIARSESEVLDAAAKRDMRRYVLAPFQLLEGYRSPTMAFPLALFEDATVEGAGSPGTFENPITGQQHTEPAGQFMTIWIDAANTEVALYGS